MPHRATLLPEPFTEAVLRALMPGEYDFQEFKSTPFLEERGDVAPGFLANYSKQLSAFANAGGGRVYLGIDDAGRIDGGVAVDLKGGGTRGWLEDVTGGLVDPPLSGFNVFEVRSDGGPLSQIPEGRAVYVVEIPASDAAPHQANDHRYYLRIAGKSRPMGHLHIQDVLRRTRHPAVRLARLGPYGEPEQDVSDRRGPRALVSFRAFLHNAGATMAHHVGAEILLPRPFVNSVARERMLSDATIQLTQRPGELTFFKYHTSPLFPTQEVFLLQFCVAFHAGNRELVRGDKGVVRWRVYADDAPPALGADDLYRFRTVRRALRWLEQRLEER